MVLAAEGSSVPHMRSEVSRLELAVDNLALGKFLSSCKHDSFAVLVVFVGDFFTALLVE